jgi:hypothetical protein
VGGYRGAASARRIALHDRQCDEADPHRHVLAWNFVIDPQWFTPMWVVH